MFDDIAACGSTALRLSDIIVKNDWSAAGLPTNLNIRISLHCAPVFPVIDPVSRLRNFTGCHTSRAARIEPVTPPGKVYCSQAFAAVSATLGITDYECAYVGRRPLAKSYGDQPLYHLYAKSQKAVAGISAPANAPSSVPLAMTQQHGGGAMDVAAMTESRVLSSTSIKPMHVIGQRKHQNVEVGRDSSKRSRKISTLMRRASYGEQ